MSPSDLQNALNKAGFPAGPADGVIGSRTVLALRAFQKANKLAVTGQADRLTLLTLEAALAPKAQVSARAKIEAPGKPAGSTQWPLQRDVPRFFGPVGGHDCSAGKCRLVLPMRVAWNLDQKIEAFNCHVKVATALTSIFEETVRHYGESEWRRLRLDVWAGCFAVRPMRGGTAYSMHSWGIAVDIDSERNQLHWNSKRASLAKSDYTPFWNIVESTGALSLGRARDFDWMHFQFARIG